MAGTTTCTTCGQTNADGTEYCVRCGTRLPDPAGTQFVNQPGQGSPEYPWEPPAEWDPGQLPAAGAASPAPTWVANAPRDQAPPGYPPAYPPAPPPGAPQPKPGGSRRPLIIGAGAVVVIAAIVAVVLVVAGGKKHGGAALNGVQTQSGTDALASAREALRAASSAEITGTVMDNGQAIRLDLTLASGDNTTGTLTIDNADVQLIKVGQSVFIKGDMDFLKKYAGSDPAVLSRLNGKWLKTATTTDFDQFTLDGFAGLLKPGSGSSAVVAQVTRSTLNGQQIVVVSQKDGSTLDIANTGPAVPLKLDSKGSDGGSIAFANYNKSVTIAPPPASEVFDVSNATPSPSPTPTPTATPNTEAALIGAWTCNGTTGTGGGNFTLNPDHAYSVVQGVNGSWGSSGDQVAFAGGTLDKFEGTLTGNTMVLNGNGRTFSCAKH